MSFVGSMLGIGGNANNPNQGASGINYTAGQAPIDKASTVDQANTAYNQTQQGLQQQQAFLAALNAQNGVGNQSAVFNQLQGVANGTGPNPALAQLNQSTAANVANQGALMASQRGSGANPALLARQAAQQGAATQQQAAGQAATLQANQSLGALNQLGGIAQNQVGNQAAATQGYNQAAQSQQQNILNGIQGQNNAAVGNQESINKANSGIANTVAQGQQGIAGGLLGAAGSALGMMAQGGVVQSRSLFADGGDVMKDPSGPQSAAHGFLYGSAPSQASAAAPIQMQSNDSGPQSGAGALQKGTKDLFGGLTKGLSKMGGGPMAASDAGMGTLAGAGEAEGLMSAAAPLMLAAKGGKVPALVSPGERYLSPDEVKKVEQGKKSPIKAGEKIPGKAKVEGSRNSYANDTVPKTLEEGGIVLPRSVTQAKDPAKAAHAFVSAIINKQKGMKR